MNLKGWKQATPNYIYDEIGGWGVTASDFIAELKQIKGKDFDLHINSPGGSVMEGNAIYNALVMHSGQITGHVDGLAASMASLIVMACDIISMPANAFLMIHNPWVQVAGDAKELEKRAELLSKIKRKDEKEPTELSESTEEEG